MSRLLISLGLLLLPLSAGAQTYEEWKVNREWMNVCGSGELYTCGSMILDVSPTTIDLRVRNLSGLYGSDPYSVYRQFSLSGLPMVRDESGSEIDYHWSMFVEGTYPVPTGPYYTGLNNDPYELLASMGEDWFFIRTDWNSWTDDGRWVPSHALASSCGSDVFASFLLYATPTCGATDMFAPELNDGWFEFALNLKPGYHFDAPDANDISIKVDTWNVGAAQFTAGLECGGLMSNCTYATPEPGSLLLFGTGLAGIALARRRRKRREELAS